ncbi:MAG: hypothetical protein OXR82_12045 [Gammaproteobacteria bacterium]|nr:hypothetical protein [Gammaproteobacteria bacterium]MDE0259100.1 hypothetical protein [Gammaproteobacteria bacterium]
MRTPHRTRIRIAIPALFLLAAGAALGALNAEDTHPRLHDPGNARSQPSLAVGGTTARDTIPIQSLLLWGGVNADRVPFLEPVFVIAAPPSLPNATGDYRVAGRAGDGSVLFSLDFEMPVIADGDGSSSFLFMLPVQPGWEGRLASVTLTGPGGSATLDEDSRRPMAILRDPGTRRIRAILRDLPPSIETQADADEAVDRDPGTEVLFSRGIPGPGAWRR